MIAREVKKGLFADLFNFWIPITDEGPLPKKNERVLVVCTNRQNKMQRHVSICEYWGNEFGKPRWSGCKEVTHWSPLPEMPEETKL